MTVKSKYIEPGICEDCGGKTENEFRACKGACSQAIDMGEDLLDTRFMLSCNCCEDCRWKCHDSFMEMKDEEE